MKVFFYNPLSFIYFSKYDQHYKKWIYLFIRQSANLSFFLLWVLGDVDGSIEAINDALQTYKSRKVSLNILSAEVGAINENDIKLAETFKGELTPGEGGGGILLYKL